MVTIRQLKAQISREKAKKKTAQLRVSLEDEKIQLQQELKILQRKPSTVKNIKLLKRTGKGLKLIGKKSFDAVKKQAILIKEQQLRDQALARRDAKIEKKIKGKRKKVKKNIKSNQDEFFGGLQEFGFGN